MKKELLVIVNQDVTVKFNLGDVLTTRQAEKVSYIINPNNYYLILILNNNYSG
jgi:hypothetical protein